MSSPLIETRSTTVKILKEVLDVDRFPKEVRQELEQELQLLSVDPKFESKQSYNLQLVLKHIFSQQSPSLLYKQDCKDVISGISEFDDKILKEEIRMGSKLALMAYSLPYYFPYMSTKFYLKNQSFVSFFEGFVSESTFLAFENMDKIVEGVDNFIELPKSNTLAGFYVRTPIRIWDKKYNRVYTLPKWDKRQEMLKHIVVGNVNVYVLRNNLEHGFELYILFRGTSNEFNGLQQYGTKLNNTQVFRYPSFDISTQSFVKGGSTTVPLFYFYYSEMIEDVKMHIYKCLEMLGIDDPLCKRVVVSGHSMGGGLAITFAHVSRADKPDWWNMFEFRTYGSPYCCNDAAVRTLEQWVIDSNEPYKFIEVVNTDDFVNIQYMLGGKDGIQGSVKAGSANFMAWVVNQHSSVFSDQNCSLLQKAMRIVQLYPELAYSAFIGGALSNQIQDIPDDLKLPFRLGQRKTEVKLWGSQALSQTYNRTLNVVFCKRRIEWANEYLGKSHTNYVDVNMNLFWSSLRAYENSLYRYYQKNTLSVNNKLRIVGMFSSVDKERVQNMLKEYNVPLWMPKKSVAKTISFRNNYLQSSKKKQIVAKNTKKKVSRKKGGRRKKVENK